MASFNIDKNFNNSKINQLFTLFITKAKEKSLSKKAKKKKPTFDTEKQIKLLNKIFNYIYIIKFQWLFSLDKYNNIIYTPNNNVLIKLLSILSYNKFSCKSLNLE